VFIRKTLIFQEDFSPGLQVKRALAAIFPFFLNLRKNQKNTVTKVGGYGLYV
jgi:hypothetical protein